MPKSRRVSLFLVTLVVSFVLLGLVANAYSSAKTFAAEDISPEQFSHTIESSSRVLVFFSSPTCTKCDLMRPIWQTLSTRYSSVIQFVEVSYSLASAEIFGNYSIYNTPVFILYVNGQNVSRHDGVFSSSTAMNQFIQEALVASNISSGPSLNSAESQSSLASNFPSIGISLLLGAAVFASPCVLPLLPGYLGYLIGKGKISKSSSTVLSLSSFSSGLIGILAVGAVFLIIGGLFWSIMLYGKLVISFALMGLGIAALFNFGISVRTPGILKAFSVKGSLVRGVATYSLLYGVLALSCSLPFMVGAMLNILSGIDFFSMTLRLAGFAIGSAVPLAVMTYVSTRGISLSASKLRRDSLVLQKVSALGMIAASVLLLIVI